MQSSPLQGVRRRLAAWFGGIKSNQSSQIVRVVAQHNEHMWPRLDVYEQQASEYLRSSWVYVAVTRIAEAAALVPYQVYQAQVSRRSGRSIIPLSNCCAIRIRS